MRMKSISKHILEGIFYYYSMYKCNYRYLYANADQVYWPLCLKFELVSELHSVVYFISHEVSDDGCQIRQIYCNNRAVIQRLIQICLTRIYLDGAVTSPKWFS